ncbi:Bug family tripartite tricarboxylate transporter substrate binding protein [Cupriavidus sp. SS-3]|uniref:Bug family tripartite tricarboxylate transporter substrate binding protein n=1 Tax=Cupriavidus sp. SS-3 TaxID=3109596 RepID=UPI002DB967B1|nr:tripartite tricarboxylate transporter substrate binding protein [Cupriavidus sp. SS-3]MEC3764098.1 tripartite tricarboxylate transporter substrate binding protein [Cupriavidus sp. SS-3]
MTTRPAFLLRIAAAAATLALAAPSAMAWTSKPVRMLVPAPAGGTMDVLARLLADQLSADLGHPVVVDNKPGAGGGIAITTMLAAPADGQTIMVTASNVLTEIPHVLKQPFDPLKDVRPVAAVARSRMVMIGAPGLPAKDLKGLVSYARANPGKLSFASYSAGTASHYAGMIMNQKAGLDLQHVPFAGSAPALTQVMGNQIAVMYDGMVTSLPMIRAGKVQVYAVASKSRSALLPQVPTFAEMGYPDMEFSNWVGVIASSKLSPELAEKIHAAAYKAAASAKVRDRMEALGYEPLPAQPLPQLNESVRMEFERNAGIVKAFNIQQ